MRIETPKKKQKLRDSSWEFLIKTYQLSENTKTIDLDIVKENIYYLIHAVNYLKSLRIDSETEIKKNEIKIEKIRKIL